MLEVDRNLRVERGNNESMVLYIDFLGYQSLLLTAATLVDHKLTTKFFPATDLWLLQYRKKIEINEEWLDAEVFRTLNKYLVKYLFKATKITKSLPS